MLKITGFYWDENNLHKVFKTKPDRAYLNKDIVESVLQDPNLYLVLQGFDKERGNPEYVSLGLNNQGKLMRVIFEHLPDGRARIFNAHEIRDKKWHARYQQAKR